MTEWTLGTTLKIGAMLLGGMGLVALLPPASWLAERVQSASTGRIRLVNAQGTAWFGQATVRIKERGKRPFYIQNLRWRLSPLELFKDERSMQLNFAPYSGWGDVRIGKAGIEVANLEFDMQPAELGKFFEVYNYDFEGKAHIRVNQMKMQRQDNDLTWNTLKANLEWRRAAFSSPFEDSLPEVKTRPLLYLGDVAAQVNVDEPNKVSEFRLDNTGGDVTLKVRTGGLENQMSIQLNERSPQNLRTLLEENEDLTTTDGQTFTLSPF
jgi:hypothetical protein